MHYIHTFIYDLVHTYIDSLQVALANSSWLTSCHKTCVMSHIWISHVTHMNVMTHAHTTQRTRKFPLLIFLIAPSFSLSFSMYIWLYMCIYMCMCIYVYVYIHIYIYTHILEVRWMPYIYTLLRSMVHALYYISIDGESWFRSCLLIYLAPPMVRATSNVARILSHMNQSCPISMSHVPYQWVMSRVRVSHTRAFYLSRL